MVEEKKFFRRIRHFAPKKAKNRAICCIFYALTMYASGFFSSGVSGTSGARMAGIFIGNGCFSKV